MCASGGDSSSAKKMGMMVYIIQYYNNDRYKGIYDCDAYSNNNNIISTSRWQYTRFGREFKTLDTSSVYYTRVRISV